MLCFINWLKVIAAFLIMNSHFKGVYPSDVFSFGGGYGLAIFYLIHGYLLANINKDTHFGRWYIHRLIRLYIPLWLVRIWEACTGVYSGATIKKLLMDFVFPGMWFSGSMVIFYPIYFVIVKYWLKNEQARKVGLIIGLCSVCFSLLFFIKPSIATFSLKEMSIVDEFSVETPYLITAFVWIACLFYGYWLRYSGQKANTVLWPSILLVGSIVSFLAIRLITRYGNYMYLEYALGIIYITFAVSLFFLFSRIEAWFVRMQSTPIGHLINAISMCTLEIYYVQMGWYHLLKDMIFPINLLLLVILIIITSYFVHIISRRIINMIDA